MKRPSKRLWAAVAASVVTAGPVIAPVAAAAATAVDLEDGNWAGSLSHVGNATYAGADPFTAEYRGAGTLSFTKNGASADGRYRLMIFVSE